jgi:hypothetical protein
VHRRRPAAREALAALPDVPNVVFMAGRKFGSSGSEWLTWAMNAHVPALVAERFRGFAHRGLLHRLRVPVHRRDGPGADESAPLTPPPGEYANSCVARERMFQHFSHQLGTRGPADPAFLRHRHALRRAARRRAQARIAPAHRPEHGPRQRDLAGRRQRLGAARAGALHRAHARPQRQRPGRAHPRLADGLAQRLGVQPVFTGQEAPTAWLVDIAEALNLFGPPAVPMGRLLDWTADWVARDMASLGKPTHYEARDGKY